MSSSSSLAIVTGAAGWLGQGLVSAVVRGLSDSPWANAEASCVRALILPGQDASALRSLGADIEVVEGDLRDPDASARLCQAGAGSTVFHTAGVIHPRRVAEFYEVNVDGTRNLMQAARDAGARRIVVVSSNSECGCNPRRDHLFDEASPYHPYMNYGRSKMLMEMAVKEVQASGGLETVVVRAPWFYGPLQPPRQTLFLQMIRDGKAPIVGDGNNLRSMAYIDNLCQGLILAAQTPSANGKLYWIADERPYTMNQIVDTVERLLESEFGQKCAHRRLRLPSFVSDVAQLMDASIQSLGGYQQKIHVLSEMNKTIACSVTRAQSELSYRPMIALEEGMRRSIRWCLERGQL